MTYIGLGYIGVGLGLGMTLIGAALGIGKLAGAALEGTARQPEATNSLQTMMIIAAALIEGLGLFALVIVFLAVSTLNKGVAPAGSAPAAVETTATH
ncbi:MAG TPA: ATP synthase F0 subunit C [Elusimicrobia bacterium]|nr:ATP synthase F0 subunit C [Elusimicrobiota bacterium]